MNQKVNLRLDQAWQGIMGGVPRLEEVNVESLKISLEASLLEAQQELAELKSTLQGLLHDSKADLFKTVVYPIDQIGAGLERAKALYAHWSASFSNDELRSLRREMEPRLAAWRTQVYGDKELYQCLTQVAQSTNLSQEQQRFISRLDECFKDEGSHLDHETQVQISEINQRLSTLFSEFSDRVLADEEEQVTWLNAEQLTGLSAGWCSSAKAEAQSRGQDELWAVKNTRSAVEPFLTYSPYREKREAVWRTFYGRGESRPETQTTDISKEILILRAKRAHLLGFKTQAHQVLSRTMAQTPEAAMDLLRQVWQPAVDTFNRELEAMTELARSEGLTQELAPWDVRYYAEKRRQRDFKLDPDEVRKYFSLERLREGMFWAAQTCFGWQIKAVDHLKSPHPDISIWSVHNSDGEEQGLFYFDPYARSGKRSGAWMSVYRSQTWDHVNHRRVPPLVLNTCNFLKPSQEEPCLLSLDEARTLFHEFGHAMHGLASAVRYKHLAGTSVVRDFVEFPSQLNEHWLMSPELRERFCTHIETGEPLPKPLIKQLEAAANAGSGFATLEYLASAVVDLSLHLEGVEASPQDIEERVLRQWGLPSQVVMRHRTAQFAHIFSGEGYASGYYCYLWADTLVADAAELFKAQGFYTPELCSLYYEHILSQGHAVDALTAFKTLRGREPQVQALLKERGLI